MIPELGHYALILAFWIALGQGVLPLAGTVSGRLAWQSIAKPFATLQFVLLLLSFLALTWSFVQNDFSVLYVSQHSNSLLPTVFRIAAVWGGHEGSLLLWVFLLALWSVSVAAFSRTLPMAMSARVLGVLGLISSGFLGFILTTSNPFDRLLPAAAEGRDLNPLLQDVGLIIHPPMLYMGYVGFSVAFAFAISALLSGRLDAAWARWSRPWTLVAWIFLTFGIGLGSWWAYRELGWGGWWFWDPVENASLMPWLIGTALIHALMVTEKRGGFKAWTVLLAIGAFSLTLLGTFLVRSGVLTSVHAFASDPSRGVFILIFLAVVVGSSLTLFAWRAPKVSMGGHIGLISRESFLLSNSVLLVVATGAVLLGTIYPLVIDALNLGKLSVGAPYFNAVFVPLLAPLLFLMVPGVAASWKEARLAQLAHRLRWVALGSLLLACAVPAYLEMRNQGEWLWSTSLGILLSAWITLGSLQHVVLRLRQSGRPPLSYWGMQVAHLGMAVVVLGITMVKGYELERDVRMGIGETVTLRDFTFELKRVEQVDGPNYKASRATLTVKKDQRTVAELQPQKRNYFSSTMPMTEAAVDLGWSRDLYVSLGDPVEPHPQTKAPRWNLRVYDKPFISWIWAGALLMVLGGFMAAIDKRYRRKTARNANA
ncbi:heme lyase CcmF/NrfE family subunit [Limnohabitans sp. 15K]|uniref:heme lyase CcmF/NrfE family subunit n=1 Tax=Limnohabitans sp. 15K TaxID=1100706 RepID=UPI000C1E2842|nr:heme lyase CcmF/NrfE family subunit [Limnohabitans sp. 15K]PIT82804.1 c-type cytochrome biogenesis protein CcmF [Limnohabitans sp. 15K]